MPGAAVALAIRPGAGIVSKHSHIAIIGDRFMGTRLFAQEIQRRCGELPCRCLDLPWPDTPLMRARSTGEVDEYCGTAAQVIAHIGAAEILITHLAPVPREVFTARPGLQFIGVARGGAVNVDTRAAAEHGVVVVNAPGRNASAVAEFTIGAILAHSRNILLGHGALRTGTFRGDLYHSERANAELSEMTVGIIGYGQVGRRVASLLRAFGSKILVHDPYQTLSSEDSQAGIAACTLDELLRRSDILSLHQRVSAETTGMLNRERLLSMRPGALLVNTARGALLDYDALYEVMRGGHLRGAVLDTFPEEPPPPDWPLLRLPNVIATPHIAGASLTTACISARLIAADLQRWLQGLPPKNALKPPA